MVLPVDLHTHSNKSDGSLTPRELIRYAADKGLAAIALSDHDTTDGIDEALAEANLLKGEGINLEVIPAIEFSTEYEGRDIHILGLYINYKAPAFLKYLKDFRDSRDLRNIKMCDKLREHGVDITYEQLCAEYPGSVLTRAHYAAFLMNHGYAKNRSEAFDKYVGDHASCFVPREKVTPMQAVELILRVGGIPILAHPILYHLSKPKLETLVSQLKEVGLVGIEAIYCTYSPSEEAQIRRLAKQYDLLLSGGSDFHGDNKPGLDLGVGYGKLFVPDEILTDLKGWRNAHMTHANHIVFSDMDGTLLDDNKNISPAIYEKIIDFTSKGGRLVLSSGRPVDSIIETAKRLQLLLPNTYIISNNGALVYDVEAGKPILEVRVPLDYVKEISQIAKGMDVHVQTYTDDTIVSPADDFEVEFYRRTIKMPYIVSEDITAPLTKPPYKLLGVHIMEDISLPSENDKLCKLKDAIDGKFADKMHTFFSNVNYLECCMKDASKGNAVRFLCDYLNIPIENAVAAGDAANDISMLQAAGHGVAMINGTEDTKKAADYITKQDNNHDGFLEVFDLF